MPRRWMSGTNPGAFDAPSRRSLAPLLLRCMLFDAGAAKQLIIA
jgi:hypothetical protein